ncbi:MAG: DUF2232 domain-containing protein [Synergistaceae bacterium]|nr:DUF2232 domain-containing protein [Synergistaceae bacterium]
MKRIIPCVIITLALVLAGSYFPVFGFIGLMLSPLPLAVLGCAEGHKPMSIAELLVEATLFFVFSPSMALYFLVGCAPLSAMLFGVSREDVKSVKKYSGPESLLICAGASIVSKLALLVVFWLLTDRNIMLPDLTQADSVIVQLYGEQPELRAAMVRVLALLPHLVPTMLVLWSCAEVFMNYALCCSLTRKLKNSPPALPEFRMWRFPVSLLGVSVLSLIAGYFIKSEDWFDGAVFVMNLQIILNVFMFVEGLAVVFWIMDGFKLRRALKAVVFVVLGFPFFWPWLVVIGMCDMVLNLRERIKFGGNNDA